MGAPREGRRSEEEPQTPEAAEIAQGAPPRLRIPGHGRRADKRDVKFKHILKNFNKTLDIMFAPSVYYVCWFIENPA